MTYIVTEKKGDLVTAFNPNNTTHNYKKRITLQIPHQAPLPPIKLEEEGEEEINLAFITKR